MNPSILNYFIVAQGRWENTSLEFDKLVNYLSTLSNFRVNIYRNEANIFCLESGKNITLKFRESKSKDLASNNFIQLLLEENDWESIKSLNRTIKNHGYRIFNPLLGFFIANNESLADLYACPVDNKTKKIFKHFNLIPLFRYENSFVYYGKSKKDNSIHLINRHLMEYLLSQKKIEGEEKDFSLKVADNISRFIALFDRGLIPISFYPAYFDNTNIINLSGFKVDKTEEEIILTPVFFEFVESTQSFKNSSPFLFIKENKIKKGGSIKDYLRQISESSFFKGKILCSKISSDVSFEKEKENKLTPRLTISIFIDTQSN